MHNEPRHERQAACARQDGAALAFPERRADGRSLALAPTFGAHACGVHGAHDVHLEWTADPLRHNHSGVEDVEREMALATDHGPDSLFEDGDLLGTVHPMNLEMKGRSGQ